MYKDQYDDLTEAEQFCVTVIFYFPTEFTYIWKFYKMNLKLIEYFSLGWSCQMHEISNY